MKAVPTAFPRGSSRRPSAHPWNASMAGAGVGVIGRAESYLQAEEGPMIRMETCSALHQDTIYELGETAIANLATRNCITADQVVHLHLVFKHLDVSGCGTLTLNKHTTEQLKQDQARRSTVLNMFDDHAPGRMDSDMRKRRKLASTILHSTFEKISLSHKHPADKKTLNFEEFVDVVTDIRPRNFAGRLRLWLIIYVLPFLYYASRSIPYTFIALECKKRGGSGV